MIISFFENGSDDIISGFAHAISSYSEITINSFNVKLQKFK